MHRFSVSVNPFLYSVEARFSSIIHLIIVIIYSINKRNFFLLSFSRHLINKLYAQSIDYFRISSSLSSSSFVPNNNNNEETLFIFMYYQYHLDFLE